MGFLYQNMIDPLDRSIVSILVPLGIWILISGVDELILDLLCLFHWVCRHYLDKRKQPPVTEEELRAKPEAAIAVFLPLWKEHRVVGSMVQHNIAAQRYKNFHFFIGAYPNDLPTVNAVKELEKCYPNVHLALVPHNGPTSKADCLNWIYQRLQLHEEQKGTRFAVVMTHDAEDLMHPESLRWVNHYTGMYDMVQVPVLPLPTPKRKLTHGIYCDEFCETQTRDMPARGFFGAFVPSCGVGTGFARRALEKLAASSSNQIFEPVCLTEDYENGIRIHNLGGKQIFLPLQFREGSFVATREYFPQTFRSAVKQRTRWVMGISLQTWERHGWKGGIVQKYWLWRDRKGLIGNPLSLLTNAICLYGLVTLPLSWYTGRPWGLGGAQVSAISGLLTCTGILGFVRLAVRACCTARVYGWGFASWVPLRTLYANCVNSAATVSALYRYAKARMLGKPLVWLKTDHAYPSQAALKQHKKKLGEVLLEQDYINEAQLRLALDTQEPGMAIGQHLIKLGYLAECDLYDALSLQLSVPSGRVYASQVKKAIARSLPMKVMKDWRVLPYKVEPGRLYLAGTEVPTEAMQDDLRRFTNLEIRFQLITPSNYEELAERLF